MKEQLVTFETAKLAKLKEFDWYVEHMQSYFSHDRWYQSLYCFSDEFYYSEIYKNTKDLGFALKEEYPVPLYEPYYLCPTQSLLQRWLREKHNILVEVNFRNFAVKGTEGYFYMCGTKNEFWTMNNYFGETLWKGFNSYEEAMEVGLQQGLKLVKI